MPELINPCREDAVGQAGWLGFGGFGDAVIWLTEYYPSHCWIYIES